MTEVDRLRGQVAAMRKVLLQLVCCALDCDTCERAGSPDGKSDCPQRVIRRVLTPGAGEPEAQVIAAAEKQAKLRATWGPLELSYQAACRDTDTAVERMNAAKE